MLLKLIVLLLTGLFSSINLELLVLSDDRRFCKSADASFVALTEIQSVQTAQPRGAVVFVFQHPIL